MSILATLETRVAAIEPGKRFRYFTGDLASAAERCFVTAHLRNTMRRLERRGLVALTQRRIAKGVFGYMATRLS